jgi:hypothetical protein
MSHWMQKITAYTFPEALTLWVIDADSGKTVADIPGQKLGYRSL